MTLSGCRVGAGVISEREIKLDTVGLTGVLIAREGADTRAQRRQSHRERAMS